MREIQNAPPWAKWVGAIVVAGVMVLGTDFALELLFSLPRWSIVAGAWGMLAVLIRWRMR